MVYKSITPITMVFVGDTSIVNGVYKPTYRWGAPPCRKSAEIIGWTYAVVHPGRSRRPHRPKAVTVDTVGLEVKA